MPARLLNGAATAAAIRSELLPQVTAFASQAGRAPALDIVLAGHDPASEIYVRNKHRAGSEADSSSRFTNCPSRPALLRC